MKTLMQLCSFFVIYLLLSSHAIAWSPFGPKTYEDCILQGMKGVTSDVAARTIQAACYKKFPNTSTTESRLIRDCTVTYNGGKFIGGRPLVLANYVAMSFPMSTSLLYLPKSMVPTKPSSEQNLFLVNLLEKNETAIRNICPDIKILAD